MDFHSSNLCGSRVICICLLNYVEKKDELQTKNATILTFTFTCVVNFPGVYDNFVKIQLTTVILYSSEERHVASHIEYVYKYSQAINSIFIYEGMS